MAFTVTAEAYAQFMGRYSEPLSARFADVIGVHPGRRALDVGCGPGALTAELVARLGADAVVGVDPSPDFVAAARERFPAVDIRKAKAEDLPFASDSFDVTAAQLVVHFMKDPVLGLSEMARVTREEEGTVAACVWDHAGGSGPLTAFWQAARDVDPAARDEAGLAGVWEGHLAQLFDEAGMRDVESTVVTVDVPFATFEQWWHPFTLGVGPAGDYVAGLTDESRERLKARCRDLLPPAAFTISASAWCVRAHPGR